ncbi:phage tail sheath protein [Glaesserella parasuis]|uniref:phage tail sheath protein n=1 Tax=Glaesserella parasuis TaxID=738 RepID=UPI0013DEF781|nr:phage tail sheath protein [Glaesserella parasuis]MDD2170678.1 phage tail sheath protein [Glaesserella parasuis]MDP0406750.1 phage tail sheath protein [Glaesserella parasuis]QIE71699.1 phage tail sheath protein [Glaesserella parasuis]
MDYLHGVRVLEINEGTRPIRTIATAIIGMVCTADDADSATFPLNKPVLITDPVAAIGKAGTQGTLARSLDAIGDSVKTPVIVVRVAHDENADTLTANVIGTVTDQGEYTGLKALLVANTVYGFKPRILGVPELDNQAVATELASICKKLRAFGYISSNGAKTRDAAIQYARNFGQRELMMIHGDFVSFDTATKSYKPNSAVARALGLRALLDKTVGWHKNLSNVVIDGVTGVTIPMSFDIQDSSTDVNMLNEKNISVPINFNGYRIWGGRTLSSDKLFAFEQYTRTAQIIADTFGEAFDWAIDKPLTPSLVKDMLEMINQKFRYWKNLGYIVDGKAWVDADINTKDIIKDGQFFIDYDYTPMPSLENLNLRQRITDKYLMDFAAKVAAA